MARSSISARLAFCFTGKAPYPLILPQASLAMAAEHLQRDGFLFALSTMAKPIDALPPSLNHERHGAQTYRLGMDHDGFLMRRQIARGVLSLATGKAPDAFRIERNQAGKPVVVGLGETWRLSFSARGPLALIGIARWPIGVDIEAERAASGIPWNVLRADEQADLRKLPESGRARAFFDLWVAKEACSKLVGTGFMTPPEAFIIRTTRAEHVSDQSVGQEKNAHEPMVVLTRSGLNVFVTPTIGEALAEPVSHSVALAFFEEQAPARS
ncbi:Sfp Phosphopantetheinyl transferase [Rhabdaerophilaceae bacterium]